MLNRNRNPKIRYDSTAMVCCCSARTLSMVAGNELENVTTLRSLEDAQFIASQAAGKDVVIVGTSFIGLFSPTAVVVVA